MRGVADKKHPPAPAAVHEFHPRRPWVRADDLDRKLASESSADQAAGVDPLRAGIDAEGDQPPQAAGVDRSHHPRRLPVEQPGLHGGRVRHGGEELLTAKHHAGIGAQRRRPDVPGADLLADHAAGTVGPDHVLSRGRHRLPGRIAQCDQDRARPGRVKGLQAPAQPEIHRRELGHDVAKDLLENVLRHLLPALWRKAVVPESENPGEPGDLLAQEARTEGDILRPGDRQRRRGAQPFRQTPPPGMLHGAHAQRLGPRPQPGRLQPRLDDQAIDSPQAQLDSERKTDRASAGDQHRRVATTRRQCHATGAA